VGIWTFAGPACKLLVNLNGLNFNHPCLEIHQGPGDQTPGPIVLNTGWPGIEADLHERNVHNFPLIWPTSASNPRA